MNFNVLTHSAILINEEIYIDPFNIKPSELKAKFIFLTHPHYDHLSEKDIFKIYTPSTIFICPEDCSAQLINIGIKKDKIIEVAPNNIYEIKNLKFQTIPAYNTNKKFHPKENGWVGYIIEIESKKLCVLGDTDLNEDNKKVKCDILFIPVGGTYTLNLEEAIELTNIINPEIAVPTHYGSIVGDKNLGEKFKKGIKSENIKVEILI